MQTRLSQQQVYSLNPGLVEHLTGLSTLPEDSKITSRIVDLVRLRVSQINGCGFCQHMHSAELRRHGEHQQRLDVLAAWREVPVFSEEEVSALAWAEALTNIIDKHVEDNVYNQVSLIFTEKDVVALTAIVLEINSWNRIVKAFHFIPELTE
ncbi:carboxymuconolactone decarboxylase family protein [Pseudoalteromonas shioyasakiensis]|uniref:carboxymuconolactone decarboxylase family protein n=1 Tax=Pseudoalteromonas TaxID=53246 RepID=UPI001021DE8A|nr:MULTISPECIES: carboxymuconolactone decarboxylase family protein [Pseudoalteromonas]MCQ8882776.1 carboxymuconolactone decarboxylase family protein [Pseudoalteromonas shioyasakiensis]NIZ05001.1 carboxymuconolactone decarboxylase family protein [Pseudoalteromonas sp. HF66]QWV06068.1 carboxymuconolactone decarboxylase family protein [Pseudoalteromonas shioyasakiensis]RZD22629.1 carboxymuconolactone decarboxylase family protein [Pseudoalteromonas sp. MEBiC 03485]